MIEELKKRLENIATNIQIEQKKDKINSLKQRMSSEDIWKDWEEGQKVAKELSTLEKEIEDYEFLELLFSEGNEEIIEKNLSKLEIKTYLSEKHDVNNAFLTIHAGQGGTEACECADM